MRGDRLERVRAVHRRWAVGDFATSVALFAPGITLVGAIPEGDVEAHGTAAIADFMREFLGQWEHYRIAIHEERQDGDRILGIGRQYGRARASGLEIDEEMYVVWTFSQSGATRLRLTWDRMAGLAEFRAAGGTADPSR